MKYLKVNLKSIRIKGDVNDPETLQADLYEKIIAMAEAETLGWEIDEDSDEEDDDF